jgi:XTP/dITP diphosphohydrolase
MTKRGSDVDGSQCDSSDAVASSMRKRLLLGTRNRAKVNLFQTVFESSPIELVSLDDLSIDVEVREDGRTPNENALKKARAYFAASAMPTLTIDGGLFIAEFPQKKQPGVFVRRIYGGARDVTDQEIRDYYARQLDQIGGESRGTWRIATVLMVSEERVFAEGFVLDVVFTSRARGEVTLGVPLDGLMIDPESGRCYSEMSYLERPDSRWVLDFLERHLDDL